MSDREQSVLAIIRIRVGRENALRTAELAAAIGSTERAVRDSVERLHCIFHQPICSFTGSPPGYYWAANADELLADHHRWRRFGLKNLIRAYAMLPSKHQDDFLEQISIELNNALSVSEQLKNRNADS